MVAVSSGSHGSPRMTATGTRLILPFTSLLVAILATTGLLFWELQVQNETLSKAVMAHTTEVMANRAVLQEEHHLVMKQHMDIIDLLQAQLYITCQINVECRRYDLALPKVLRELKRP